MRGLKTRATDGILVPVSGNKHSFLVNIVFWKQIIHNKCQAINIHNKDQLNSDPNVFHVIRTAVMLV